MAEERKEQKKPDTHPLEPIVVLFVIAFVFNLIMGGISNLSERYGLDSGNIGRALTGKPLILPLEKPVSIGDEVITNEETEVYANPGDTESIFSVKKGTLGRVVGGPAVIDGEFWWEVEFEDGRRGWVRESSLGTPGESPVSSFFARILPWVKIFSVFASLVLLTFLIYTFIRLKSVQLEVNTKFNNYYEPPEGVLSENSDWRRILDLSNSENPNDWKGAIMEADVLLDEALSSKGYRGNGLGERLKAVDPTDFTTLDYAWDAHKVRNKIAHEGGDFVLTNREAKRVLGLYEASLKEFGGL